MSDPAMLVRNYLLYVVLPLWVLAGVADYMMHRRTQIEYTSGAKESALHALQLSEAGVPVMMGLIFDVNALVILVMIAALVLHEATALWDLSYTTGRRYISPFEQHVHSFLEILPLMAVSFVAILYWNQFLALWGMGSEAARWELRWKPDPLPPAYLATLLGAVGLFIVLPFGEELWRCLRVARRRPERHKDRIKHAA
jgi:hypothetical protein